METQSRKRAAEAAAAGEAEAAAKRASTGAAGAIEFPSGDFSTYTLDEASGWYRSPDGAWSYNSSSYIFFHAATNGYYTYDSAAGTYVSVQCAYSADGQLYVVQAADAAAGGATEAGAAAPAAAAGAAAASPPPEFAVEVEGAQMQGRRQKQEDRFTVIPDLTSVLSECGCAPAPPLPAAFFAVYDGHAGHDTAEFAAEQLHKDIATCLAAKQTAAASEGTPPWSDELVVAAIKEVRN